MIHGIDVHIPLRPEPEGSPLGEVSGDGEKESEGSLLKEESEFFSLLL